MGEAQLPAWDGAAPGVLLRGGGVLHDRETSRNTPEADGIPRRPPPPIRVRVGCASASLG